MRTVLSPPVVDADQKNYQNLVYAIRPYTSNLTPITNNIPSNRCITLEDFTIIDENGEIQRAVV